MKRSILEPLTFEKKAMKLHLTFYVLLLASPGAFADCFDAAAAYHHVNGNVLRAIAWLESHNQPTAEHKNENGSVDYGVMQINSIHLSQWAQYGVNRAALMQPCKNVYVAAWHLRHMMDRYGNTWSAIGSYHSATPQYRDQYVAQIKHILQSWHRLPYRSDTVVADAGIDAAGQRKDDAISIVARNSLKGYAFRRSKSSVDSSHASELNADTDAPTLQ
jgi:hypothetical protein